MPLPLTPSVTPSNTATPSNTPSNTPTITPSTSFCATPTPTPTQTPTQTNTPTQTQTVTPTQTPTPTQTQTPTPTSAAFDGCLLFTSTGATPFTQSMNGIYYKVDDTARYFNAGTDKTICGNLPQTGLPYALFSGITGWIMVWNQGQAPGILSTRLMNTNFVNVDICNYVNNVTGTGPMNITWSDKGGIYVPDEQTFIVGTGTGQITYCISPTPTQTPTNTNTPSNTPTVTPTKTSITPTPTPTQTPTPTTVYRYYRVDIVNPGGSCTEFGITNIRTTNTLFNDGRWYCCTYNGVPGFKIRYNNTATPSGTYPITLFTGGNSVSCSTLTC